MKSIISLILLFTIYPSSYAKNFCGVYLSSSVEESIDHTDRFISYLARIYNENTINQLQLQTLINHLEQENKMINPVPHQKFGSSIQFAQSKDEIHYWNIQNYIEHAELDKSKILNWAKQVYDENKKTSESRSQTAKQTALAAEPMVFYPFNVVQYENSNKKLPAINHNFEMMATEVTQYMWATEMGYNPSHFLKDELTGQGIRAEVKGRSVLMLPDHPVESITFWSALVFANKTSEKHGLPPVYDLSKIEFVDGTSAEKGNLEVKNGEGHKLRINAPEGKLELAEGYRLPAGPEMEHAMAAMFAYTKEQQNFDMMDAIWCRQNSNEQTHPVAKKIALPMGAGEFYDILGNVWEWTHQFNEESGELGTVGGSYGRSLFDYTRDLQKMWLYLEPNKKANIIGFRLVRTLK